MASEALKLPKSINYPGDPEVAYTQGGLAKQTPDTGFQCLNLPATLVLLQTKSFCHPTVTLRNHLLHQVLVGTAIAAHRNHLPQAPWCVYVLHNHCCSHPHHQYHSVDPTQEQLTAAPKTTINACDGLC